MSDSGANTSGNPPRLFITKMVLENFKSYGGVREVGPFHKRFSSIVGPNGSGKSNVIDAMLFVFGKKAKKLRLNKVSELIHKSDGFQDLEYCRVSVHFVDIIDNPNDDDGYETVKGTELVVTRIAYKNNTSKYLLDNKTSTFTEVGAILRKRGIDLDNNRFLILQGEVEQIAMMQPKAKNEHEEGLLEFLEDIIGSNRHLEQINEEEKKLDVLNEERGEKLARLKVTETERDNLEGSKTEAEGVVRKSREVREKKNKLYQKYCADARNNVDKINEEKEELVTRKTYENKKLQEKEAELEAEEKAVQQIIDEHDSICNEMAETKLKFTAFERQDIKMRENIKHNKGAIKKLSASIKVEENKAIELSKAADVSEASLPNLNNNVEALTAKQLKEDEKLDKLLEAAKAESDKLRSGLEAKQIAIAPVKQQVSEVEAKIGTTVKEIQLVKDSATSAQAEVDKLEKEIASIEQDQSNKKSELKAAKAELAQLESSNQEDDASIKEKEMELAKNMSNAVSKCEEAKATLSAQSNRSGLVSKLMAACRSGQPLHGCGLMGRLGDLASIDAKYDVAISTACGALDHLVVTNADGASKAIQFLKKHNIGRASFIVLDSIRAKCEKSMNMPFTTPAKSERLFDLAMTKDPEVKLALYFALRNTLVSKNLDEASSVAYVGDRTVHRVVTLNGELIDQSGAMSGGGNRVKRGSMTIASSAAVTSSSSSSSMAEEEVTSDMVMQLEKLAAAASEKLASFRQKMATIKSKKAADAESIKKLKKTIPKLEMSISSAVEMLPGLKSRREALLPKCQLTKEEASRVTKLEAVVEKARADAADITNEFRVLQMDIDDLQAAILAAGGEPVKVQRKKVAATKEALEEAESKVSAAQVDAKDSRKASEKASKAAEKAKADLLATEEKQRLLLEECAQLEKSAQEVTEAFEAAELIAQEKKKLMKKATVELEASQKLVAKIKAVEVEINIQLEEYEEKLKQNMGQLKHWTAELAQLNVEHATCLKDWGDLKQVEEGEEAATGTAESSESSAAMDEDTEVVQAAEEQEEEEQEDKGSKRLKRSNNGKEAKKSSKEATPTVLPVFTDGQLAQYDKEKVKYEITLLEEERDKLSQSVNMSSIQEYRNKAKEYNEKFAELDEVTERRDACRNIYEDMRRKRLEEFMVGFGEITLKLKEMYQMITLGGDAELELVDSLDPFSEGIVFSVRPPKKSWKNIANLSGGEKTLSSLALVFALHHYKPTPLYVMDEIDAALDFKNVSIVANYIKERTKNAQFVIISLRNNMFELADRLVGIYKTNDTTKSVTINPKLFGGPEVERLSRQVAATKDVSNPLRNVTNISAQAAAVN